MIQGKRGTQMTSNADALNATVSEHDVSATQSTATAQREEKERRATASSSSSSGGGTAAAQPSQHSQYSVTEC